MESKDFTVIKIDSGNVQTKYRIKTVLRDASVFLHFSHDIDTPDWHTDHSEIIESIHSLARLLLANSDTCPLCGHDSNRPSRRHHEDHGI